MQIFVETSYVYHWSPLIGCLTALLPPISGRVIGAVSGLSYRAPDGQALPDSLAPGLTALGATVHVVDRERPNRIDHFRARQRIRSELRAGRAVAVFGVGESAFGPTWGLLVGVDDDRSAWRRDGPMTEQVSPWWTESALRQAGRLSLITVAPNGAADPSSWPMLAADAWRESVGVSGRRLLRLIDQLQSGVELEPQRFAYDIQALAANWGEAAAFWREHPDERISLAAQQAALALSRCATLFPYPMGGQPNQPGVRTAAVSILRDAADILTDSLNHNH